MSVKALDTPQSRFSREERDAGVAFLGLLALIVIGPFVAYPFFVMQMLCIALFACAFNLLIGYVGLLSFGHAMFLGMASYACAHAAKVWGLDPVLAILVCATGSILDGGIDPLPYARNRVKARVCCMRNDPLDPPIVVDLVVRAVRGSLLKLGEDL